MKKATKGILMSGMVYPGLGQLALGRKFLGGILIALATTGLAVIVYALTGRMMAVFSYIRHLIDDQLVRPENIADLYILKLMPTSWPEYAAIGLLIGCWIYSFVHAYYYGRKLDGT